MYKLMSTIKEYDSVQTSLIFVFLTNQHYTTLVYMGTRVQVREHTQNPNNTFLFGTTV